MTATGHIRKRVGKNGAVSYQLTVESPSGIGGKRNRNYATVKGTKKQAEAVLRQMISEVESQTYVRPSKITVAEWMDEWMATYIINSRSVTTIDGYKNQIENYLVPALGDVYLQDLTPAMVQRWVNQLRERSPLTGKPLAPKTVRNIWLNLSTAMDRALIEDLIKKNPCQHTQLPQKEKYEADVYDQEEIEKLLEAANGTDMELPMLLEVCLGLRRGELLALKWDKIDFEHARVTICENLVEVNKVLYTKTPKTRSGIRTLEIPPSLLEKLREARLRYLEQKIRLGGDFHDDGYVVCQENGKPYKPDSMGCKFRRFLKDNGLRPIRFHDLRHTNATLMLTNGISPKVAQQRLGHADFSTTMNIYSHVLESVDREAANAIDQAIFGSTKLA